MRIYRGDRTLDGLDVTVDSAPLDPKLDVKTISQNGYEWGYAGPEPAQLAFAILCEHYGDPEKAAKDYSTFMEAIVSNFNNEWEMSSDDIDVALKNIGCR